ncbi:uncharacterized protein LOC125540257 isoform X1 [Triticum urartu]|uniref:uncharacterized protein LOC125540257 isoform X1 n=1 Tax=Triticum urartu TaxID=4572 RepID=UPI002044AC04|nr:uncharacterized protein LOC125540257 isoform X1 [Triticum urartu]
MRERIRMERWWSQKFLIIWLGKRLRKNEYWLSLMVEDRDMLIKVLCELNVDPSDKDQSEGLKCAPPKSCPSEPSSPGQEKSLLNGFSQDSTLPGELPHAPPKLCPSGPPSPDQEKILLEGFSQDSTSPSEQLGDSTSTPECVTPCSSMESDSDKRSLNTKLKESELNADAKSFTPLAYQRPPQPPVSDAAHCHYPNSMLFTPGSGLPVGMGFPELYGSMHVAYNSRPGPLPPQGYTYLSWPQSLQLYGGAPIFDSAHPGSFPQAHAHPSRPQSLQLYGGVPTANSAQAGSLPQGYAHVSRPQPYGGVPTANSAQPGSSPQGYAQPCRPQQYRR